MTVSGLYFLGKRNYVQGATLLKFALLSVQAELGLPSLAEVLVRRFKQIHEVDTPVALWPESRTEPSDSLRATLSLAIGDHDANYKLIALPGSLSRYPDITYRQINYREHGDTEASIELPEAADFWEILTEAVQLTKVYHLNKYSPAKKYRFIVGGFEQLRCIEPIKGEPFEINCKIKSHILIKNTIYNQTLITVKSKSIGLSFFLPFIGKEVF